MHTYIHGDSYMTDTKMQTLVFFCPNTNTVYMHTAYMYICIHSYIYACIHICKYSCMSVYIYAYIFA